MPLIECDDCGREVSTRAERCPHCGGPIGESAAPFGGFQKGTTTRPDFWHDRNVGAVGCLAIFLILLIAVMAYC